MIPSYGLQWETIETFNWSHRVQHEFLFNSCHDFSQVLWDSLSFKKVAFFQAQRVQHWRRQGLNRKISGGGHLVVVTPRQADFWGSKVGEFFAYFCYILLGFWKLRIWRWHGVWKSQKKSHSTLRAKRATFVFSLAYFDAKIQKFEENLLLQWELKWDIFHEIPSTVQEFQDSRKVCTKSFSMIHPSSHFFFPSYFRVLFI